ncbi:hypothetical protein AVEN_2437-1 [Araneus ventricosus]|uniref:Uncharacterized protein n=1 Tax=Araneus ventricosus TaxID=182803 RepID=A0A4Y2IKJ9_ARAVE|nr:hypothetical protein AVEN_2437-1 [Araneus ventricosus]
MLDYDGLVILTSRFEATQGYFGTELVILNHGQMTIPQLAPHFQTSTPHQREDVWPSTYDLACNRPHTWRIFSGIWFRTWNPPAQSRDLTTRPPRPIKL